MADLPFELRGKVAPGKQLGSKLGFPTANLVYAPESRSWPREGVYVGIARVGSDPKPYLAILNQGRHPTSPDGAPTVEAHLLQFPSRPLYGENLSLSYRFFLRSEQAFPSLEALQNQLALDREQAVAWAREHEADLL